MTLLKKTLDPRYIVTDGIGMIALCNIKSRAANQKCATPLLLEVKSPIPGTEKCSLLELFCAKDNLHIIYPLPFPQQLRAREAQ